MNTEKTIGQELQEMRSRLRTVFPQGETEAFVRIIFRNVLNYETADILMHKDSVLPDFTVVKIEKVVDMLLEGKPIQYIFGNTWFCGRQFHVNRSVLIPRPETEELVDMIVAENQDKDLCVLDAGTGSGCIAVTLALDLKFAVVNAIDISAAALDVAADNAACLKAHVSFRQCDMLALDGTKDAGRYDIIVSNPPYVTEGEKSDMGHNVLDYEPGQALFVPDCDPLRYYRALVRYGRDALTPGGRVYFEINSRFPKEISTLLSDFGYTDIEILPDMQKLYRFAKARKNTK